MGRAYILGAGASAGYENGDRPITPPTARTFFHAVGGLLNGNDGLDRSRFPDLWAFLGRYYRVAVDRLRDCELDIEEVLTLLDVGRAKPKARRQLLDLIALTLEKVIHGSPCQHHQRIVNSLRAEDAIITFNWDLLVDNIVALNHEGGPDYGTNLLDPIRETAWPVANGRSKPLVLKPHGSMNWMTCRKCRRSFAHVLVGKTAAICHAGQDVPCRHCNRSTEPLMIPPTLIKNYKHPVIKVVWAEAARVLRLAEEIVVVGYSLPPTDFKARWLFMEASANRAAPLRSLTIADQDPSPLKQKFQLAFHADETVTRAIKGGIRDVPCGILRN
jgi:NAD-dependent SIR2 family protein deacetylase